MVHGVPHKCIVFLENMKVVVYLVKKTEFKSRKETFASEEL